MKAYIWTVPTRIFHWLLVIGFTTAYFLGDYNNLHFAFGAFVGALVFFRIIFGIIGPKYSNFKDFPMGLSYQKEFLRTYLKKAKTYIGHNPAASVVMLSIMIDGVVCAATGYLLYATKNLIIEWSVDPHTIKEIHEVFANLFWLLIGLHLLGILGDKIYHRETGTLQSMFTGYKNVEAEDVRLNLFHKLYLVLWLIVPFYLFYWAYGLPL